MVQQTILSVLFRKTSMTTGIYIISLLAPLHKVFLQKWHQFSTHSPSFLKNDGSIWGGRAMRKLKGNQAVASIRKWRVPLSHPIHAAATCFISRDRLSINAISARAWAGWGIWPPALITGKVAAKLSISIEATGDIVNIKTIKIITKNRKKMLLKRTYFLAPKTSIFSLIYSRSTHLPHGSRHA